MSGCTGCTRRTVLQGIGLALAGCKLDREEAPVDAPPPDSNEPPVPCEPGNVCIDLNRPSSATLVPIGGSLKIQTADDSIILVRTAETVFEATSAIYTHRRCPLSYNGAVLRCACHGSQFTLEGAVVMGPAVLALTAYETAFDPATNIVSIIL